MSTEKKRLPREKQCAKCPWKVTTNPHDIPDGYCSTKHKRLKRTMRSGYESFGNRSVMACHHSNGKDEMYCVGWLAHALGPGNDIGMRFKMLKYDLSRMELVGEQHETFEDTLPEEAR